MPIQERSYVNRGRLVVALEDGLFKHAARAQNGLAQRKYLCSFDGADLDFGVHLSLGGVAWPAPSVSVGHSMRPFQKLVYLSCRRNRGILFQQQHDFSRPKGTRPPAALRSERHNIRTLEIASGMKKVSMKKIHKLVFALFFGVTSCVMPAKAASKKAARQSSVTAPGLQVDSRGMVIRDGKIYRGIGVNYFDAFCRTLLAPGDTTYEAGFATLRKYGIPFARFSIMGYWPSENKMYFEDKARYFAQLDGVVKAAEKNHVGLIPSFFWNLSNVPDLMKEPIDAWQDPNSKTRKFMATYTREVVMRYRNSPALWGWEFGNEFNLTANLPNAAEHRPQVAAERGTPPTRSQRDEMTSDIARAAFAAFAQEVRKIDAKRFLSSGNSMPRTQAWHNLHGKTWDTDTADQWAAMLLGDNPDPINSVSVHVYEADVDRIRVATAIANHAKKPLFIGEFGVAGPPTPESKAKFAALLAAVEAEDAPLAALWVYDFAAQDSDWNVTATNARSYQLQAISDANKRLAARRP